MRTLSSLILAASAWAALLGMANFSDACSYSSCEERCDEERGPDLRAEGEGSADVRELRATGRSTDLSRYPEYMAERAWRRSQLSAGNIDTDGIEWTKPSAREALVDSFIARGSIVDESGNPVPNARVTWHLGKIDDSVNTVMGRRSGSDGSFAVEVLGHAKRHPVIAIASDGRMGVATARADNNRDVQVVLKETGRITASFDRSMIDEPWVVTNVSVKSEQGRWVPSVLWYRSNNGVLDVDLPPGTYRLSMANSLNPPTVRVVKVTAGNTTDLGEIAIKRQH